MNGGWGSGRLARRDLQGFNYSIRQLRSVPPPASRSSRCSAARRPARSARAASTRTTASSGYVSAYDVNAPPWGADRGGRLDSPSPSGRSWPAASSGPASTTRASRRPTAGRASTPTSGSWTSAASRRTTSTTTRRGGATRPSSTSCPTGTGRERRASRSTSGVTATRDRVELFLNGQSLGAKEMPRYGHLEWKVPYAPGTLEARGYRGGKLVATDRVETTGAPAALRLKTDRAKLTADGEDLVAVEVAVVDAQGQSRARRLTTWSGSRCRRRASVAGVGNGDPSSHEPDKASAAPRLQRPLHGSGRRRRRSRAALCCVPLPRA